MNNVWKRLCLMAFGFFALGGGGLLCAQSLPELKKDNSFVYDTENGNEAKFAFLITVTDYAHEGKILTEIYGYGGKEKEEWADLGEVALVGFGDSQRLNYDANKYIRYRYIGIQVKSPKRSFKIVGDQKKKNMNFYVWEGDADASVNPLPFNSDHKDAYVFDIQLVDDKIGGNVRIQNNTESGLASTLYGYNLKKHAWEVYGEGRTDFNGWSWIEKKKLSKNLKDYRYYALDIFSDDGEFSTPDYNFTLTKNLGGLWIEVKEKPKEAPQSGNDELEELKRQLEELKRLYGQGN